MSWFIFRWWPLLNTPQWWKRFNATAIVVLYPLLSTPRLNRYKYCAPDWVQIVPQYLSRFATRRHVAFPRTRVWSFHLANAPCLGRVPTILHYPRRVGPITICGSNNGRVGYTSGLIKCVKMTTMLPFIVHWRLKKSREFGCYIQQAVQSNICFTSCWTSV